MLNTLFQKESQFQKQQKMRMNKRFMHFWDLIIDNHISEAINFLRNPIQAV
jgi:hypothetical protein